MNPFDSIIIGILGFCLIRGIFRGLVRECVSSVGVVVAFYSAGYYYPWMVKLLSNWISNEIYPRILGFFGIFLGIVFIINVMIPAIKYILGLEFLRVIDRSFGGGIGMTKGIMVSCILLIIFTAFLPKGTSIISDSKFMRPLTPFSEKLVLLVHNEMKREFYEKIQSYLKTEKDNRGIKMQHAEDGDKVKVHYKGKLESGQVLKKTKDSVPLIFQIGDGNVLSEFEKAVMGMAVGGKKTIKVPPEKVLGLRHDYLIMDIPKSEFPETIDMFLGKRLDVPVPCSGIKSAKVVSVDEETIRVDANHPLKGETLIFDIELLEIL